MPGELGHRVRLGLDIVVEVGDDLEQLGELRVGLRQEVEEPAIAQERHLDVERHRLRLERLRGQHAHGRQRRFDPQLPGLERALEALIGERPAEQLQRVEIEKAAIGAVQGTRADHQEVGDQGALLGTLLDSPEQPLEAGLVLEDHGRRSLIVAIDQQIDPIAPKRRRQLVDRGRMRCLLLRLGVAQEDADMAAHVRLEAVEIGQDGGLVPIGLAQRGEQVPDRQGGRLVVERANLRAGLLHPARDVGKCLLEPLLQRLDLLGDLAALVLAELLEGVRLEHLAVLDRGEEKPGRCPKQRDALLPGLALDDLDRLLLAFLQLVLEDLPPGPIGLVLKGGFQRVGQILDQALHIGGETAPEACAEMQGPRTARLAEVADIAEIVACRAIGSGGTERALQHRAPADTAIAHDEEVATCHGQRQGQIDGVASPGMAEWLGHLGLWRGQGFCHGGRVDLLAQLRCRQGFRHGVCHRSASSRRR